MAEEVSAGGVIIDEGQVLVLRHARGEWIMPKGHLESGETEEEAALREVQEETNLTARILDKIGETRYSFRRKDDRSLVDKRVHWFLMELSAGRDSLSPRVQEGIQVAEWLSPAEALRRLTFPGDREIVSIAVRMSGA